MNRRFFIFLLSFLLAHTPLAFAPQGHDLDNETQDEGRQSLAPRANDDVSNSDETSPQSIACTTKLLSATSSQTFYGHPIFRAILDLLPINDLKACRPVCKEWYRAATYVLSLKSGLRLQLPPLDTAPFADRDMVRIFLDNLCRGASKRVWETPRNPLRIDFDDNMPLVLEKLKPAAVMLTLPKNTPLPVPNFQDVRHVICRQEHVTDNLLAALQKAKLETLDLSDSKVKAHCILPAFEHPESLTRLLLARSNMAGFNVRPLVNLTHLNINRCKLTLQDTWSQLIGLTQLRVLLFDQRSHRRYDRRLSGVYDDRTHADCMRVLTQNTHLTELNLNGHVLGPAVADALENKNLRILQLHGCGLGDAGFQKLALLNLEKLVVSRNELTENSAQHLCSTLRQVNEPHLRHLDLGDNALGDDVMLELAAMTYLDKLCVPATGMTDQGASNLMDLGPLLKKLNCNAYKTFSHSMCLVLKEHFKRVI